MSALFLRHVIAFDLLVIAVTDAFALFGVNRFTLGFVDRLVSRHVMLLALKKQQVSARGTEDTNQVKREASYLVVVRHAALLLVDGVVARGAFRDEVGGTLLLVLGGVRRHVDVAALLLVHRVTFLFEHRLVSSHIYRLVHDFTLGVTPASAASPVTVTASVVIVVVTLAVIDDFVLVFVNVVIVVFTAVVVIIASTQFDGKE